MKRTLTAFVLGGLLGLPAGAFLWYAFSPLLFDEVVQETLTTAQVIAEFGSIGAGGNVMLDFGDGNVITLVGVTSTAGLAAGLEIF